MRRRAKPEPADIETPPNGAEPPAPPDPPPPAPRRLLVSRSGGAGADTFPTLREALAQAQEGDRVVVISGRDKGKQGEVLKVLPKDARVLVHGVNLAKRHTRPSAADPSGGAACPS